MIKLFEARSEANLTINLVFSDGWKRDGWKRGGKAEKGKGARLELFLDGSMDAVRGAYAERQIVCAQTNPYITAHSIYLELGMDGYL